jgi:hypothetical protein
VPPPGKLEASVGVQSTRKTVAALYLLPVRCSASHSFE